MLLYHLLLAFQLEHYHITRFLKFAYTHWKFWFVGSKRQKLDWTKKAILLFMISMSLFLAVVVLPLTDGNMIIRIYLMFIAILVYPLLLVLASFIILPLELFLKRRIIAQAKQKVAQFPNLVIIGITGSYGKTSVKEILKIVLESSFNVIATPGTHNTPLGISEFIVKHLNEATEVMIIEMGAYLPGDIDELCKIVKPHIAILTGITEQHLERFKHLETIIQTKFEITKRLGKSDFFFTDGENEAIQKGLQKYTVNASYTIKEVWPLEVKYLPNFAGITFMFEQESYTTKLLGKHTAKNIALALSVARQLGVPMEHLQKIVKQLDFIPHRLEVLHNLKTWIIVIDDSFNGNREGVKSTIDLLLHTPFLWRKVYLTPGLVELGKKADEIHREMGNQLAEVVDLLLLIENSATLKIQEGLLEVGYSAEKIKIFPSALKAHKALSSLLKRGDVMVFQNDWTDNYQ